MSEPVNPYASPESDINATPFAEGGPLTIPGLKTTGVGLSLVYYGIVIVLLAFLSNFFGSLLLLGFAGNNNPAGGPVNFGPILVLAMVVGAAVLLGGMLTFAGQIVCLFVPSQSGARGYIIAAILLQILNVVFFFWFSFQRRMPNGTASILALIFACLSGFLSSICFVLFLRKVSEFIDRRDLMDRARNVLILAVVLISFAMVTFVGMTMLKNDAFGFFGIVVLIVGLIAFVMYANLINALRKVLLGKAPRMQKSIQLGSGMGTNSK